MYYGRIERSAGAKAEHDKMHKELAAGRMKIVRKKAAAKRKQRKAERT